MTSMLQGTPHAPTVSYREEYDVIYFDMLVLRVFYWT